MNENMDYSELDEEAEETFRTFSLHTGIELSEVRDFTAKDVNKLLDLIFENLRDLSDLELAVDIIKNKIDISQDLKARLKYQLNMTKKDILDENLINIYLVYNAAALGVWLTSSNPFEFLKRFLIVGIIGVVSYDVNARYFASDYRKAKSKVAISEIEKSVDISKYDIKNINKFRDMYIKILEYELNKLSEIKDNNDYINARNNAKVMKLIHELDLDYLLANNKVKRKIK